MDRHDALLAVQQFHIATIGWAVTAVYPTAPGDGTTFAYTIGLTEAGTGHPEFLIAGLDPHTSHVLLNDMAHRVHAHGRQFRHGQTVTDLLVGYPVVLVDGPISDTLLPGTAIARYGRDQVRLRQIVWPDPKNHFPWDPGYAYPADRQPVIGHP